MTELKNRIIAHRRRWNIAVNPDADFQQFKNRLQTALRKFEAGRVGWGSFEDAYCHARGYEEIRRVIPVSTFGETVGCSDLAAATDLLNAADVLQYIFIALEPTFRTESVTRLVTTVQRLLALTPAVGLEVAISGGEATVYPAGARELDHALVNEVLDWLGDFPGAARPFQAALAKYMSGDPGRRRNLLDDLRVALEQLLRGVLGNEKSLENQKDELPRWLRARGVHQQVVNLAQSLLFGPYAIYQNEAVKHGEEFAQTEIEFMIYQTGVFMRLIITAHRAGTAR